jgi:endonuclease/exonuclease/phosphatase family metal-dependent hydrolase
MRGRSLGVGLLLAAAAALGCHTGRNYPDPLGPRYAAGPRDSTARRVPPDMIRFVTFNIAYAREVDSAIVVLSTDPAVRDADIILLQEMDERATRRVAAALDLWYVYYPAIFRFRTNRDLGNAVLARWPIVDDAKIPLPHTSRYAGTQRIATAASVVIGDRTVRAYSTHLGTPADIGGKSRDDQLRAIVDDAARFAHVVIGGDMNSSSVGRVAQERGFAWPTREGPKTTSFGRWDHLFVKGFAVPEGGSGTVADVHAASDHRPVWAIARLVP